MLGGDPCRDKCTPEEHSGEKQLDVDYHVTVLLYELCVGFRDVFSRDMPSSQI